MTLLSESTGINPYTMTHIRRLDVLRNGRGGIVFADDSGKVVQAIAMGLDEAKNIAFMHTLNNKTILKEPVGEANMSLNEEVADILANDEAYQNMLKEYDNVKRLRENATKYFDFVMHSNWMVQSDIFKSLIEEPDKGCPTCENSYYQWLNNIENINKQKCVSDTAEYLDLYKEFSKEVGIIPYSDWTPPPKRISVYHGGGLPEEEEAPEDDE